MARDASLDDIPTVSDTWSSLRKKQINQPVRFRREKQESQSVANSTQTIAYSSHSLHENLRLTCSGRRVDWGSRGLLLTEIHRTTPTSPSDMHASVMCGWAAWVAQSPDAGVLSYHRTTLSFRTHSDIFFQRERSLQCGSGT